MKRRACLLLIAIWVGVRIGPILPVSRDVEAAAPQRIVSLVPAATEMLFAMGAGGRIVGVGSYDNFPPEATRLPKLGGLLDPNVERLFALKPDLAVVYSTQAELRRQLEKTGIPIFLYVHRGMPDITQTIRALGARIDSGAPANALANQIDSDVAALRARVQQRPRPRTLLVIGREPGSLQGVVASGGYGFLHDMLEAAGATDAVADIKKESVPMSTEMLLTRAPDVIIELHYGTEMRIDRLDAERLVWNRLGSLPAVRNKRVHLLAGDEFVVPGPRIVGAIERLSKTIHPQAW